MHERHLNLARPAESRLSRSRALPALARDERGAIMVLGLFLALAAVAALWSVIGIGDAVLARERSQDAADSVAYASAVMHARGMNFIALINLVMLAMAMLYVVLSVLDLLLSLVLLLTGIKEPLSTNWCGLHYASWIVDVDVPWCQVAKVVEGMEVPLYKLDRAYFARYKKLAPPLFKTQSFAASVVPYLGIAAGAAAGAEYSHVGIAYSHSLWPGGGAPRKINFVRPLLNAVPGLVQKVNGVDSNLVQDRRVGLPVDSEPAYNLCVRGVRFGLEWVKNMPGKAAFGGLTWREWSSTEPTSSIFYWLFQLSGETTRLFFCRDKDPMAYARVKPNSLGMNVAVLTIHGQLAFGLAGIQADANDKFYFKEDGFWRITDDSLGDYKDSNESYWVGPKRIVPYAYNGNDWMQIWAFARDSDGKERAQSNVSLPARVFGRTVQPESRTPNWFFAGAEYYFDCGTVWQSSQCNKGSAALYQLNWRARLRRWHTPNAANTIFEVFLDNVMMGAAFKSAGKVVFGKMPKVVQESLIKSIRNDMMKVFNHRLFTGDTSVDGYFH